jgi:hypothetical protein
MIADRFSQLLSSTKSNPPFRLNDARIPVFAELTPAKDALDVPFDMCIPFGLLLLACANANA